MFILKQVLDVYYVQRRKVPIMKRLASRFVRMDPLARHRVLLFRYQGVLFVFLAQERHLLMRSIVRWIELVLEGNLYVYDTAHNMPSFLALWHPCAANPIASSNSMVSYYHPSKKSVNGLCHLTCEAVACMYGRHMNVQPGLPQPYLNWDS